jgi:ribosome-associated heat shock protein Hsp15
VSDADDVRIDKWLWAARFFKTRSLAADAVDGGKVHLNGVRVKRSKALSEGDTLSIRQGPFEHIVVVKGVSERRGPAKDAQQLYEETEASKAGRERIAAQLRLMAAAPSYDDRGRPTKKDRRELERMRKVQGRD